MKKLIYIILIVGGLSLFFSKNMKAQYYYDMLCTPIPELEFDIPELIPDNNFETEEELMSYFDSRELKNDNSEKKNYKFDPNKIYSLLDKKSKTKNKNKTNKQD